MTKTLIIEAPYYENVAKLLRKGATNALDKAQVDYDLLTVPGALEIPMALKFSLTQNYDAYIVLGCVIRGETSHYDIVCNESAHGIYKLAMTHNLAIGNAILTVETHEQAIARADPDFKNKGGDAANAALSMFRLKNGIA